MPRKQPKVKKWCSCENQRECHHHWNIRLKAYVRGRVIREERKNLLTADYEEACVRATEWEAVYERLGREASQADGAAPAGSPSIEKCCELDEDEGKAQNLTDAALEWRRLAYKWIQAHWGKGHPKAFLDYDKAVAYVAARREGRVGRHSRATTIEREFEVVKRLCAIAKRKGWLMELPLRWPDCGKDGPREGQRGFFVPPEVSQAWMAELSLDAKEAAVIYAGTAIRAEELYRIDTRNIVPLTYLFRDAAQSVVAEIVAELRFPADDTKTGEERSIPLTREVYGVIMGRAKRLERTSELFEGLREHLRAQWRSATKAIGYHRSIHPRALRHTMATLLAGKDVRAAQAILGHSDLSTTTKYVHSQRQWNAEAMSWASGHIPQGTFPQEPLKVPAVGRGDRNRTCDPLTPSRVQALQEHLTSCNHCQQQVAQHSQIAPDLGPSGHINRADLLLRWPD